MLDIMFPCGLPGDWVHSNHRPPFTRNDFITAVYSTNVKNIVNIHDAKTILLNF